MQSLRKPQDPSRRPLDWFLLGYCQNKPKSKLDVAESNFTLISIYIRHRETGEEHINNVLFVAGLSGGEFSALVLICRHTSAPCAETPNLPSMHRSKLPEAESHRFGMQTQAVLHQRVRQLHSRAPYGKIWDLVGLEDMLHSLHFLPFFPSSGLHTHDNSSRKCKLGRGWLLNFPSCYSSTAYPPSLNISWGDSKTKLLPGNDSVPPVSKAAAQYSITQQPQAVGATCESKVRTVSFPYSHSFRVGRSV